MYEKNPWIIIMRPTPLFLPNYKGFIILFVPILIYFIQFGFTINKIFNQIPHLLKKGNSVTTFHPISNKFVKRYMHS